jgi:hypothetical protein
MKFLLGLALAACSFAAAAQEQELRRQVQRALIQRDQQSAEFAARLQGHSLEALHQRQLLQLGSARPPLSYQRERLARERDAFLLRLSPPIRKSGSDPGFRAPLPLPGGSAHAVDPIPVQGFGG